MMILGYKEITKKIPQRFPFLMVDRVLEIDMEHAVGIKNVSHSDPYLVGHFPDEPIFPGVLLIESSAQIGGMMISENEDYNCRGYIAQVNDFKFLSFIIPGDTIYIYTRLESLIGAFGKVLIEAKVDDKLVAKGLITFHFNKSQKIDK